MEAPGGSWRLLEAPGSSQAGGPPDLFTKHREGANAITFPRHIPKQVILKDYKKMKKLTFKLKLKNFALSGSANQGVGRSPQGLNPEPKDS